MENANFNNQNLNANPNATKPAIKFVTFKSLAARALLILVVVLVAASFVRAGLSLWLATFISVFAINITGNLIIFFALLGKNRKNGKSNTRAIRSFIRNIVISIVSAAVVALIVSGVASLFAH